MNVSTPSFEAARDRLAFYGRASKTDFVGLVVAKLDT